MYQQCNNEIYSLTQQLDGAEFTDPNYLMMQPLANGAPMGVDPGYLAMDKSSDNGPGSIFSPNPVIEAEQK